MSNNIDFTNEQFNAQITMYGKVLGLLLILTTITFLQPIFVAKEIEGTFVLQLIIAGVKAFLILAYYMHLKYESSLFKAFTYFAGGILLVFFIFVGIDSHMDDSPNDMFQQSTTLAH